MFLRLTNAAVSHKGMPLALRSDLVLTVFQTTVKRGPEGNQTDEKVTIVYSPQVPQGSWEVKESVDEVLKQLNKK